MMSHNLVILQQGRTQAGGSNRAGSVGDFLNAWFVYFRNQLLDSETRTNVLTNYLDSLSTNPMVRNQSWGGLFLINWWLFSPVIVPWSPWTRCVQCQYTCPRLLCSTAVVPGLVTGGTGDWSGDRTGSGRGHVWCQQRRAERGWWLRWRGWFHVRLPPPAPSWNLTAACWHQSPHCLYIFSCVKHTKVSSLGQQKSKLLGHNVW